MGLIDFSLDGVGGLLTSAREAITGEKIKDPTEMAKVALQLEQLEGALKQGHLKINEQEARNPRLFVAGWRPFIGWGCGFALLYASVFEPIMRFTAVLMGYNGSFPVLDTSITMQVLLGILGLGAMRSHDKLKGTDTK